MKGFTSAGLIAFSVALAPASRAQFSNNYQTNTINGVTNNWSGDYYVGYIADVLLIQNRGLLTCTGSGYLGYGASSSNNKVLITDTGSVWSTYYLYVGFNGSDNQLSVTNGGALSTTGSGIIGYNSQRNSVLISGSGSTWSVANGVQISGYAPSNTLIIANGGAVYDNVGRVGSLSGGSGTVWVVDQDSVWSNRTDLYVGDQGAGNTLTITNGGKVINNTGWIGYTCQGNSVQVVGSGSTWVNLSDLHVGYAGPSNGQLPADQLTIANGGTVRNVHASLRPFGSVVTITGSNSVWYNAGNLSVESGQLTIGPGSSVMASNVYGAYFSANQISIAGGSLYVTNAAHNAVLDVRCGTLTLSSGLLQADIFIITNPCAQFIRTGGTLIYGSAVLTTNLDADGDGIPNGFEQGHGLDPLNAADATADNDGDGFTNLQEFQAGTDPTNNASAFRIQNVATTNNDVLVTWMAGGGRTNVVQSAPNLAGSYTNVSLNIVLPGSGDVTTNYLDAGAATSAAGRFYRIRLVP